MKKKLLYITLVLAVGLGYIFCMYGNVLTNPNAVMTTDSGDGFDGYYDLGYPLKTNEFINMQAFNYPYGSNTFLSGGHPEIIYPVYLLSKIYPSVSNHFVGIVNISMILSIFFSYIILYLLLSKYIKSKWYALLFAFAITLLQPQLCRMSGHYTLAFSIAIPLTWYCLLLFFEKAKDIKYAILLTCLNTFWLFIHPYMGCICIAFSALYSCYIFISTRELRSKRKIFLLLTQILLPVLCYYLVVTLTDTHEGRVLKPWGFWVFYSSPSAVFIPHYGYLADFASKHLTMDRTWEGLSYVGVVATFTFFFLCVFVFLTYFQKITRLKIIRTFPELPYLKNFNPAFFASVLLLLFAMFPSVQKFNFLDAYLPSFITQFRAAGRFSWVFYYVITVYSGILIFYFTKKIKIKWVSLSLQAIAPLLMIIEAIPSQKVLKENVFKVKNEFLIENLSPSYRKIIDTVNVHDYQAIIALPYRNIWTDQILKNCDNETVKMSELIAFYTRLPLTSAAVPRASMKEAVAQMQFYSPAFYDKIIKNDITSNKKFLVLVNNNDPNLTFYEKEFIQKATLLFTIDHISVLEILPETVFNNSASDCIAQFETIKNELYFKDGLYLSELREVIYLNYDHDTSQHVFLGKGAYQRPKESPYFGIFTVVDSNVLKLDTTYEISFWFYVGGENYGEGKWLADIYVKQWDEKNGKEHVLLNSNARSTPVIFENWALAQYTFKVADTSLPIYFGISNTGYGDYRTTLDEVLIRPISTDVYKILKSGKEGITVLYKNGHVIKK